MFVIIGIFKILSKKGNKSKDEDYYARKLSCNNNISFQCIVTSKSTINRLSIWMLNTSFSISHLSSDNSPISRWLVHYNQLSVYKQVHWCATILSLSLFLSCFLSVPLSLSLSLLIFKFSTKVLIIKERRQKESKEKKRDWHFS